MNATSRPPADRRAVATRRHLLAPALLLLALADAGRAAVAAAADIPLASGRIRVTRSAAGVEQLSFVSSDPAVSYPAPGMNPGDPLE